MRRLVLAVAILALAAATHSWAVAGDQEIAGEITEKLREEQEAGNLQGFDVKLRVADGNVTLDGRVKNKAQKALVSETARSVDGVKDVVSRLQITGEEQKAATPATSSFADIAESTRVSDEEIASQIAEHLSVHKEAGRLKGFGVEVSVKNGLVTMTGSVATAEQRELALEAVEAASGVKDTDVRLAIEASPTPVEASDEVRNAVYQDDQATDDDLNAEDRRIGEELSKALEEAKAEGNLRGFGIGVHVDRGYVWLRGEVSTREQQQAALDIASRIRGVRKVVNDLTVSEPPVVVDDNLTQLAIAQAVNQRFQTAAQVGGLNGADLDVKVGNEMVLLSGVVANPEQERLAINLASQVPGVSKVRSDITVSAQAATAVALPASYPMAREASLQSVPSGVQYGAADQTPRPLGATQLASYAGAAVVAPFAAMGQITGMAPAHLPGPGHCAVPARYDHPYLPGYAWPSYAAHPNYAAVTYPKQYSASAWPYIGPFYPYPQVPLGWRKVTLKWDDGWWQLNFCAK
jgi:osmotically-inducible protein OsmY